ncbi:hypothetical protein PDIDSM_2561 [Penicillium digitatum]|nr:hypothetical protein PDIDSM_2561 [Penicillium digitatum]
MAHTIGCHHIVTNGNGSRAITAGFDGEIKAWSCQDGHWLQTQTDWYALPSLKAHKLSPDTCWCHAGGINVWDLAAMALGSETTKPKAALSPDGRLIASGHEDGAVYIFTTETGRMPFSVSGLVNPVRAVAFSPKSKILAAAGDSKVIVLYDTSSGEQIANLSGHSAWVLSLSWSDTGEYLLSSSFDGKVKVWSMETKTCVATHSETDKAIWNAKWLPKIGKTEGFATAGANRSIAFYREATG